MRTISEMRERLIQRAAEDEAFRVELLADPKVAVKAELDLAIPDGVSIHVHKEDEKTAHLVLPPTARLGEQDLAHAAGGFSTAPEGFWDF